MHVEAAEEVKENGDFILQGMERYNRDKAEGTRIVAPTRTFEDKEVITMGDVTLEILHLGPAHGPGDTQVWIPQWDMMIAGDIAFHERMPPIFADTCTSCWVETWETAFAPMNATYIIPGHGHPTNLAQVTRYTHDYLVYLRGKVGAHLEEGGDLEGAFHVDQTPYLMLDTFDELATKNAGRVFEEMEFE